jgi:hypothetical protein
VVTRDWESIWGCKIERKKKEGKKETKKDYDMFQSD